jgi:hypothetical protein
MSPKGKRATATIVPKDSSPLTTRRTSLPVRSPINDDTRTQLVSLSSSQRRRSGFPLLAGLPDQTPKRRKAKEPVLFTEEDVYDQNLGSHLEQVVDDRHQLTPPKEYSSIEGAKGPSAAIAHTVIESAEGSSAASAHTAIESAKGSSAGKERVKGSS